MGIYVHNHKLQVCFLVFVEILPFVFKRLPERLMAGDPDAGDWPLNPLKTEML
jgi:hypothetical protein